MSIPIKQSWLQRVIQVNKFHVQMLQQSPNWRVADTAEALCRSIGSVSQDLLLARYLLSHERQIKRFRRMKDALEFVRSKKSESKIFDVEL